jgi:hypothetical protein
MLERFGSPHGVWQGGDTQLCLASCMRQDEHRVIPDGHVQAGILARLNHIRPVHILTCSDRKQL